MTNEITEELLAEEREVDGAFTVDSFFFKATPHQDGRKRYIYFEPSNENIDAQREIIMKSALLKSREHFLQFGNVDIEHLTLLGWQMGIKNPYFYEIGRPVEVTESPFVVKSLLKQGTGESAKMANFVWSSMAEQDPPQPWYPSVAGVPTLPKEQRSDGVKVISACNWTNVGLAKEPINRTVQAASLSPEQFAKAVTAGDGVYEDRSSALTGGSALRKQSLEKQLLRTTIEEGSPGDQIARLTRRIAELEAALAGYREKGEHVMKAIVQGAVHSPITMASLVEAFHYREDCDLDRAYLYSKWLLRDVAHTITQEAV